MFHKINGGCFTCPPEKEPIDLELAETWKILEGDLSVIFQADRSDFLTASAASWQVALRWR